MVMGSSTVVLWGNSLLVRLCLRAWGRRSKAADPVRDTAARLGGDGRERSVPARRAAVYHPRCARSAGMRPGPSQLRVPLFTCLN
ncbi:MAG: hypothetical protein ACREQ5_35570, partial [Candidatus Dormibacteria bacterium]